MKRIVALLLAVTCALSLAACGGKDTVTGAPSGSENQAQQSVASDALEILNKVWDSFDNASKFPAASGNFEDENSDGPGFYNIDDADAVEAVLGLPQSEIEKISEAASLMHLMNANSFTCAVYHVKDASKAKEVADAWHENIKNRQWMCGFPDKMVVCITGDYVTAGFGLEDSINELRDKLVEKYDMTEVIYDENIEL